MELQRDSTNIYVACTEILETSKEMELQRRGSGWNLSQTKHWWKTPTRSLMNGPHVTLSVHAVNNVSTFKDTRQTILSITQLFI